MPIHDYVSSTIEIRAAHAMAWVTSTIALLIGTIGMLNTMMMSVFERTREIGVLRAIGWRKWRVIRMILAESLLLSLAGAVLGCVGGIALTQLLSTLPTASGIVEGRVPFSVLCQGFGIAIALGLVGGAFPAVRAARLLPTEALRHE
jgi:putative ABC transport system permease protein